MILTVHYYNPFEFTHQGTSHSEPTGIERHDTEMEREAVRQDFQRVRIFADKYNIPVHVGEYGTYCDADIDSRVRWTTFVTRFYEEQDYSWACWEFNSYFGIYNPAIGKYLQPLVDALLYNPFPEPMPMHTTTVFESNFEDNGLDGWYLYTTSGGKGNLSVKDNKLNVELLANGMEAWHLQLMMPQCPELHLTLA